MRRGRAGVGDGGGGETAGRRLASGCARERRGRGAHEVEVSMGGSTLCAAATDLREGGSRDDTLGGGRRLAGERGGATEGTPCLATREGLASSI